MAKTKTPKNMTSLKEVVAYAEKVKPKLLLQGWSLDFCRMEGETSVAAECTPDEKYRRATLRFFPPFFKEDLDTQKEIILHEMCHVITGIQNDLICAMRDGQLVSHHEQSAAFERQTTWLSDILFSYVKDL
jgi:hypothetical protein